MGSSDSYIFSFGQSLLLTKLAESGHQSTVLLTGTRLLVFLHCTPLRNLCKGAK